MTKIHNMSIIFAAVVLKIIRSTTKKLFLIRMKNFFVQQHKKSKQFMQLKKISNTLKKSCVVMTKIHNGSIINAALAKKVTCDAIVLY